ncbi:MAG: hypothetical protein JWM80_4983, partial [Cyanobacteria bacterium RYN_339]|nr:hypothetical protein [Cyanobacteria bacterium RYN_339]
MSNDWEVEGKKKQVEGKWHEFKGEMLERPD